MRSQLREYAAIVNQMAMAKEEVLTLPRRVSPTSPIKSTSPNSLLLYLRTSRRLSQTKLSKLAGVNLNTICQCELRGVPLSLENLRRLADFFDVSLDALAKSDLSVLADLPPHCSKQLPASCAENAMRGRLYQPCGRELCGPSGAGKAQGHIL